MRKPHVAPRKLESVACEILGHTWHLEIHNGHLTEVCSTCGKPAPELSEED